MNNIENLLEILIAPIQRAENVLQQMLTLRDVNSAVGAQLDIIGRIVGQDRQGVADDEEYRRFVRARIRVNRSQGVGEDLIAVAKLAIGDDALIVLLHPPGDASIEVDVTSVAIDTTTARILLSLLLETVSAGVRLSLTYAASAPAGLFRLDSGPGLDVGRLAGGGDYSTDVL